MKTNTQIPDASVSTSSGKPIRVLVLEHSAPDVELCLQELDRAGVACEAEVAATREEFQSLLHMKPFDIILSDYRLPGWNGMDALEALKTSGKDIPFIMVTGTMGEEAAVECIKQGVHDYILKDHLARLPSAVQRALSEKSLRDERARAAETLQESEARNRELVENAAFGIFRSRASGEFLDVNPTLVRMLGYDSREELLGRNLLADVYRYPHQRSALLEECNRTGRVDGAEVDWRKKDSTIITVRLNGRHTSAKNNESAFDEVFAEDVTQLRAMEQQLRGIQKFEAIGQLAGGIAHDFNNVIGAIHGWAEIGLGQAGASPFACEHFRKIRDQAERAASLTRQLLAFARRQILEPRDINLNQTVEAILAFLEKVIGSDVELKVLLAPDLATIRADPSQIEQVLMNLCLNARDAMAEGGRLVIETGLADLDEEYCRYHTYATPGRYVTLNVSDTGIGMDTATRERVFEPFFTTKELGKGTGLGLATVYGIVKQHNGFIEVYSEPGVGSTFRVYLPVSTSLAKKIENQPVRNESPVPHGQELVLLAEDHEGVRSMALETLEGFGYRVVVARDGEEALHLFEARSTEISLAILDVVMPRLGGPALYNKLSAIKAHLPVIFTTGYMGEIATLESLLATGAALLQKPYSPASLGRKAREVLDAAAKTSTESFHAPARRK